MRLRSTAFPTFFETVNPIRAGPLSRRSRACSTKAFVDTLAAAAAARKSALCLNRSMETRAPLPAPIHALSRLRPRARRAATTLRPPLVAILARKPCRRLRTSLLGW